MISIVLGESCRLVPLCFGTRSCYENSTNVLPSSLGVFVQFSSASKCMSPPKGSTSCGKNAWANTPPGPSNGNLKQMTTNIFKHLEPRTTQYSTALTTKVVLHVSVVASCETNYNVGVGIIAFLKTQVAVSCPGVERFSQLSFDGLLTQGVWPVGDAARKELVSRDNQFGMYSQVG